MAVMATGVHRAGLPGGKRQPGVLAHGQRIHVTPQQRRTAGVPTAQHRDNAIRGWSATVFERQSGQGGHDFGGSLRGPQPKLRLAVDSPA